jgi:hypothetical protein
MAVDLYTLQLFSHHPFEQGVGYMELSRDDRIGKAMVVLYNPVVVYHRVVAAFTYEHSMMIIV